jgi:hypothetical protein
MRPLLDRGANSNTGDKSGYVGASHCLLIERTPSPERDNRAFNWEMTKVIIVTLT